MFLYRVKAGVVNSKYHKDWQVIVWIKPSIRSREKLGSWTNRRIYAVPKCIQIQKFWEPWLVKQNISAGSIGPQATDLASLVQRHLKLLQDKTLTKLMVVGWGEICDSRDFNTVISLFLKIDEDLSLWLMTDTCKMMRSFWLKDYLKIGNIFY